MSEKSELVAKLKSEGARIHSIFCDFTDAQWEMEVYTEGTIWTIRDILSHFVTSERGLLLLFEQIRIGGKGVDEDFSIDHYNSAQLGKTKGLMPSELLDQYLAVRAASIKWVMGLGESDLGITGRHPFLGWTTLREMIKMLFLHNQIHYRDLRKILSHRDDEIFTSLE